MKNRNNAFVLAVLGLATLLLATSAQAVDYIAAKPLTEVIKTPVAACGNFSRELPAPVIQWGPDAGFLVANGNAKRTAPGSIFAGKKLDVSLYRQDDFVQQLKDYMSCKTPFLRGTADMVAVASELLARDPRTVPVPITQLSWSHRGDAIVVKEGIKTPKDLCGKTIAVQYPGPHMYFITKVLTDAGCKLKDVKFKWVKDLESQSDPKNNSPALAFKTDPSVDAAAVIIPDALALTSNGTVGTGSEDSVRGAHILLTSADASTVIADLYWVRRDYYDAHKADVVAFTNGFMQGAEKFRDLMKSKGSGYKEAIAAAADLTLGSATSADVFADLYSGAMVVGYAGNIKFFNDARNPRSFEKLIGEMQPALMSIGLLNKIVPIPHADWDWKALSAGLSDTKGVEVPRFVPEAVQKEVETRAKQATEDGVLFKFEVYFEPEQNNFPAEQYRDAFKRAITLATTYGGALMSIEGHSDPTEYLRLKKGGVSPLVLTQSRQATLNLSYSRSNAVKDSLVAYAKQNGVTLDASQFGIVGLGVSQPNTPKCTRDATGDIEKTCYPATEQEWNATRRVVFKIIRIQAESSAFKPL